MGRSTAAIQHAAPRCSGSVPGLRATAAVSRMSTDVLETEDWWLAPPPSPPYILSSGSLHRYSRLVVAGVSACFSWRGKADILGRSLQSRIFRAELVSYGCVHAVRWKVIRTRLLRCLVQVYCVRNVLLSIARRVTSMPETRPSAGPPSSDTSTSFSRYRLSLPRE